MNIVPLKLPDPAGKQHVCSCPFFKHSDKLIPTNSNKLALVLEMTQITSQQEAVYKLCTV